MKETLNSQLPYNVTIGDNSIYSFITEGGIKYIAYFICCECYTPELKNTFMFNFEHEGKKRISDVRIRETIVFILDEFFKNNKNSIIYICDSLDGRELYRKRLFKKWFENYRQSRDYIYREEITEKGEYYNLCASLLIHISNPDKENIVKLFKDLKGLFLA